MWCIHVHMKHGKECYIFVPCPFLHHSIHTIHHMYYSPFKFTMFYNICAWVSKPIGLMINLFIIGIAYMCARDESGEFILFLIKGGVSFLLFLFSIWYFDLFTGELCMHAKSGIIYAVFRRLLGSLTVEWIFITTINGVSNLSEDL